MKTLLLLVAFTWPDYPEGYDKFEQFLCDRARLGLLDCTQSGSKVCQRIKEACKPWWEEEEKPKPKRWLI